MSERNSFPRQVIRSFTTTYGQIVFERRADGAVGLRHVGALLPLAMIPANEWASLVASMTDDGEDGRSFRLALAAHTGSAHDPDAAQHHSFPEIGS